MLRDFFAQREVMEVDTPTLAKTSVTDTNIHSIMAKVNGDSGYLQTSPEYFMKRMLASGVGDIYYLGKAFRDGEQGPRHNPEFTLLEWYRIGWDEHQLMAEIEELIHLLLQQLDRPEIAVSRISYRDCFMEAFTIDPHHCALADLQELAVNLGYPSWCDESRANCLDLLFSEKIEPTLPDGLVFVHDYPACQSALAQTKLYDDGAVVSRRFEVFLNRMELANGYFELTDAAEQRQRFEQDLLARAVTQKSQIPLDNNLHQAMQAGLPSCAGVALGVDRLLMQLYGVTSISDVIAFNWDRC